MKYTLESKLIWENYLSPKEGGLPLKADMSGGMPFGGSPAVGSEDEEEVEQDDSNIHDASREELIAAKSKIEQLITQMEGACNCNPQIHKYAVMLNHYATEMQDCASQKEDTADETDEQAVSSVMDIQFVNI